MSSLSAILRQHGMTHEPLSPEIIEMVRTAAVRLVGDGIEPETVDTPDLLRNLAELAEWRGETGPVADSMLASCLVELAALALLWADSADDLAGAVDRSAPVERQGDQT